MSFSTVKWVIFGVGALVGYVVKAVIDKGSN